MAYFLGYKQYGKLKPIKLIDDKGKEVPDKILDIMRFTTSFKTEQDLKNYLIDNFLIEDISNNLCYLIGKGSKKQRRYEVIRMGDTIYLSNAAKYFSSSYLKKYVSDHKYDSVFLNHLLGFYLKKYGILNLAVKRFEEQAYNYRAISDVIDSLLNCDFSQNLKNYLMRIKEIIDAPESVNSEGNIYLTRSENAYFQNLLDNLGYTISQDDDDIRCFINFFKSKYKFPLIPTIQILEKINSMCHYIMTVGKDNFDGYDEDDSLHSYCEKFISLILYTYDSSTKDYKRVNGKYKVNERNLCDLAMFIANYEEYIDSLNVTINQLSTSPLTDEKTDDYDEEEVFLEESDFARYGVSSEDYGYRLYHGDGDNRW